MTDEEIRAIWNTHWNPNKTLTDNVCAIVREAIKYQARADTSRLSGRRS